jgi:hypothetical protein
MPTMQGLLVCHVWRDTLSIDPADSSTRITNRFCAAGATASLRLLALLPAWLPRKHGSLNPNSCAGGTILCKNKVWVHHALRLGRLQRHRRDSRTGNARRRSCLDPRAPVLCAFGRDGGPRKPGEDGSCQSAHVKQKSNLQAETRRGNFSPRCMHAGAPCVL